MVAANSEIWSVDTEWGFRDDLVDHESAFEPVVFCAVGLRSGRRLHFWGRDDRLSSFIHDHGDDLFVSHNVVAEMKYLLRLGITPPPNWFDTYVAWRYLTNKPHYPEAGLSAALRSSGLPHLAPAAKHDIRDNILHLRFSPHDSQDQQRIVDYCFSDCDGQAGLFERIRNRVPAATMAHWCEYQKAVARMELRGIPFDVLGYGRIMSSIPTIRESLIAGINRTWPVFVDGSFSTKSLVAWCKRQGIAWPMRPGKDGKPYHVMDDATFKQMESRHPFIAEVRQVRKTLTTFGNPTLVVDPVTQRHYFSTVPFRAVTGRNQPKSFVFGGPKWLRYLIVPESPEHDLVYVDYSGQEIGIAAALSGDPVMRAVYESSDSHLAFAIRAGAAPADATKATHKAVRNRYKTVNLGVQYGQTAYGISETLGIPFAEAAALVDDHRKLFPGFWEWSERAVQGSIDCGLIRTPCGWQSIVPPFHKDRTWFNWPMQATGGDIMRLTVTYLDRQNVRVLAPVHDGFVLSCHRDERADLRDAVHYACTTAVEQVLPGFSLKYDFTVFDEGRFADEDGRPLWDRLQQILRGDEHALAI